MINLISIIQIILPLQMSEMFKRVIVGIAGIPVLVFIFLKGGIFFLSFAVIVSSLALWELFTMSEKKFYHPLKITAVFLSSAALLTFYFAETDLMYILFAILIIIISAEVLRSKNRNPLNPVIVIFGIIYITFPFALLCKINNYSEMNIVIYLFILIWTCDTGAYLGGKLLGRNMLSSISPKKTIEGSAAGFILTVAVSLVIHYMFPDKLNFQDAVVTGIFTGIFSQFGDLFESLIKRYFEVKDSSDIIPGHGGVLDRFDSIIFIAPVIFIYFRYLR